MSFDKYRLRGIVESVGPRNETPGGYVWREVVVTDGSANWPQHLPITFQRERAALLDAVAVGDVVDVEFTPRGRVSGEGRTFAQVVGLAIAPAQFGGVTPPASPPPAGSAPPPTPPPGSPGAPAEDLPF